MSSPTFSSPLAEALANEDIAFSSPKALRALPIGSSWPGPLLPTEVASPSRKQKGKGVAKRLSKLLPGEKDPQPTFRNSIEESLKGEASELSRRQHGAGPSRRSHDAAVRSPTDSELSSAVTGHSCRHDASVGELSSPTQRNRSHNVVSTNYDQSTGHPLSQDDIQPKDKGKGKEEVESVTSRSSIDFHPLHRGALWPDFNSSPSSLSSFGSWVTARGEESQEADGEGKKEESGAI